MVGGEGLLDASDEMQTTSGKVTYCSESYSSTLGGQESRMLAARPQTESPVGNCFMPLPCLAAAGTLTVRNTGGKFRMDVEGTGRARSSKATWHSVYSMLGPLKVANLTMLVAIILAVVFQPKANDPSTYWAAVVVAFVMLVAAFFLVRGGLRSKRVRTSAAEDRRRIAAGLPLDPEDPEDQIGRGR